MVILVLMHCHKHAIIPRFVQLSDSMHIALNVIFLKIKGEDQQKLRKTLEVINVPE